MEYVNVIQGNDNINLNNIYNSLCRRQLLNTGIQKEKSTKRKMTDIQREKHRKRSATKLQKEKRRERKSTVLEKEKSNSSLWKFSK